MTTSHSPTQGHRPERDGATTIYGEPAPADSPADSADPLPHSGHETSGHGGHGWMMLLCCVPMLLIAGVLVATGVAGSGFVLSALLCTAMMAAMMFMMPGGHGGHGPN